MNCSKCGKEIANDSMFCEYCGTKQTKIQDGCRRRKVMLYTAVSFLCVALLFVACYAPGLETGYKVIKLGDTWGFVFSKDIYFIVDWKIKSLIAIAWLGLLVSYPITYFKVKGGFSGMLNWGDEAYGVPGMLLILAVVGMGLLLRTGYIAGEYSLGGGFWLMLSVLILLLFVAFRLWKLTDTAE